MKRILFFVLFIQLVNNFSAQVFSAYGIKIGAGVSTQFWNYEAPIKLTWGSKEGTSFKIFGEIGFFEPLTAELELGFLRKGIYEKIPITTAESPDGTRQ
ncbi:MAG: hypothetical protein KKD86_03760 [Bacteroidetes bacterium]|nr:hypothetical protein [Bacteroidota bacterium]MBU1677962.1 hypothetical protein [Bacteroidota bacterium]